MLYEYGKPIAGRKKLGFCRSYSCYCHLINAAKALLHQDHFFVIHSLCFCSMSLEALPNSKGTWVEGSLLRAFTYFLLLGKPLPLYMLRIACPFESCLSSSSSLKQTYRYTPHFVLLYK